MNQATQPSSTSRLLRVLVTLVCLAAVATILWQLLPKAAFSSDLSQVGQGRPALVMLREIHVMGGEQVLEQMHTIYPDYTGSMAFLVVHTGHPDGQAFARTHNVGDGSLVLFDADGEVLGRSGRPESSAALRQFINQHLSN